ncbi:MAG: radical SAM protein [bacterium]
MLKVNEIFLDIQGESAWMGKPCVFVRLTGCNLRCAYCDTRYAYNKGKFLCISDIMRKVRSFGCRLVEITGGEPLLQTETPALVQRLLDAGFEVLVETNGTIDIRPINRAAVRIMDIKCPGSGEHAKNSFENIKFLQPHDNIKFVITDRKDYLWAKRIMKKFELTERCEVLFSPAIGWLPPHQLADWIIADALPVRFQPQLHKLVKFRKKL